MVSIRLFVSHAAQPLKLPSYSSTRSKSTHVYKEVIPWKNAHNLADHLAKNVVYNEGGVVAINKPYGVASSSRGTKDQYLNAAPVGDTVFNLYDALPYLAKKIGYNDLYIASVPERYTSGVTVLATSPFLQNRIKRCLQLSKVCENTMNRYYVVVVGSPNTSSGSFNTGITMSSKVPNQPILVPVTKTGLRKQHMNSVRAVYDTLSTSNLASLLAIRSSTAKLNALRIVCTDKFVSPILGDNMFGSRVRNVLGRDVLVGFNDQSIKKPMKLKTEVLEALELTQGQELIVPTHLHLQEVYLAKFFNLDIVLRAPLPSAFQWSCKQLGLEIPECKPSEKFFREELLNQKSAKKEQPIKQEEGERIEIGVTTQ